MSFESFESFNQSVDPVRYAIVDLRSTLFGGPETVATCATLKGARRSADRRNLDYGAHRYGVRAVMRDGSTRAAL